ncbi:MAG TPA: adenosine deaminase [Caulobacteraceae bacterium]
MTIASFIHDLPKCELHVHIEGTLEPELKFKLAERNQVALAFKDEAQMRASYVFHDLPSFLGLYYSGMEVLRTASDFYDLAMAYLAKARSQNVLYAEIFFDPQAHTARGVSFDVVIRGLRRAQIDAEQQLGIRSQLIMCFLRDWSAEFAMATLLESLPYKEWIAGVGLDSDEKGNPPSKFRKVFQRAREEGYLLTMHCDVNQEDSVAHIWECVELIGVSRIDHGVNALEDPALCKVLAQRKLGLTVCPISNAFVTDGPQTDVVGRMLELGLRVTVNSDDPAYFGGYIEENFALVQRELDLDRAALAALSRNAFEAAWLPRPVKDGYLAVLDAALA